MYVVGLKVKKKKNWFSIVFWTTVWSLDVIILGLLIWATVSASAMTTMVDAIYRVW